MKKIILPLVIIVLLLTGCSVVRLNSLSLDEVIDYSFDNIYKTNKSFKGYKIYLPNDMTMINDEKRRTRPRLWRFTRRTTWRSAPRKASWSQW